MSIHPQAARLAATLPQELFSIIIDAAGLLCPNDGGSNFHSCSLVCVYWANRFRPLAYQGRHTIGSEERALRLKDLVMGPRSDRLTPLVKLIGPLVVWANPTDKRSWHHVLAALVPLIPADKFAGLLIERDSAKPKMFQGQSVHWGIPYSVSALPVPYCELRLLNLQFASLRHIIQLVRKLPCLKVLDLWRLKWDEDAPPGNSTPRQQARSALTRVLVIDCQDASLLLLRLLLVGSARVANPLQVLPPTEQAAIIQLVEHIAAATNASHSRPALGGTFKHRPTMSASSVILRSSITLQMYEAFSISLHFYHERTVFGCAVVFTTEPSASIDLSAIAVDTLWDTLALFPDLQCLIVGLSDEHCVEVLVETHQALWASLAQRLCYFRFASQRKAGQEKEWVAYEPGALDMTGETWSEVHWRKPDHGEALDNIVSAQLEANSTAPDRRS